MGHTWLLVFGVDDWFIRMEYLKSAFTTSTVGKTMRAQSWSWPAVRAHSTPACNASDSRAMKETIRVTKQGGKPPN